MVITITIGGLLLLMGISNVTCVCLTLTPKEAIAVSLTIMTCPLLMRTILFICTGQIMTCEPIDIIYFTLGTGNFKY